MNLRNQKGITGMDITASIMIILIFTSIIVALYQNYATSSKNIERKAQATEYAIETIEEIKSNTSEYFNEENSEKGEIIVYNNETIESTGFSKTAKITDYAAQEGNSDKKFGYAKEVEVSINYKVNNKEESVDLSTVISKEN